MISFRPSEALDGQASPPAICLAASSWPASLRSSTPGGTCSCALPNPASIGCRHQPAAAVRHRRAQPPCPPGHAACGQFSRQGRMGGERALGHRPLPSRAYSKWGAVDRIPALVPDTLPRHPVLARRAPVARSATPNGTGLTGRTHINKLSGRSEIRPHGGQLRFLGSTACSRPRNARQEATDGSKPCAPSSTLLPVTSTFQPSMLTPRPDQLHKATHSKFKRAGKRDATGCEPAVALVLEIACSWEAEPPFLAGAPHLPHAQISFLCNFLLASHVGPGAAHSEFLEIGTCVVRWQQHERDSCSFGRRYLLRLRLCYCLCRCRSSCVFPEDSVSLRMFVWEFSGDSGRCCEIP